MPEQTPKSALKQEALLTNGPWHLPAPAKLNLMLHITGRRPDGYHELQTLFQLLDWGDELSFEAAPTADRPHDATRPPITLQDDTGLTADDNIITRAAALMAARATNPHPLLITLTKRIPMGGGLGGGSTDAATTLWALNKLWSVNLDVAALANLGQELGADVPVFVRGHSAWGEGIGEQLTPVDLSDRWFLVAHPGVAVSTAALFGDPGLTRNSQKTTIRSALRGGGRNDFEPVARRCYPAIDRLLQRMSTFGDARLTGTGACCFLSFASQPEALQAAQDLRSLATVFIAQGANRSPLLSAMAAFNQQL